MSVASAIDLTTVAAVQNYLGGTPAPDPNVLQPLVTAASTFVLGYISRNIAQQSYSAETYNGTGTDKIVLRQAPITAVSALSVFATQVPPLAVPPAPSSLGFGFQFDDSTLYFIGGCFDRAPRSVQVSYTAGYPDGVVTAEPLNIPAAAPFTATLIQGMQLRAITSLAFTIGGALLTRVAANPASGQYTLNGSTLGFAPADQGKALLCSYTTNGTPADLAQAVNELVGFKFIKRGRLDKRSETLQQQTVAYDMSDVPASARTIFDLYKRPFYTP